MIISANPKSMSKLHYIKSFVFLLANTFAKKKKISLISEYSFINYLGANSFVCKEGNDCCDPGKDKKEKDCDFKLGLKEMRTRSDSSAINTTTKRQATNIY